MVLPAPPRDLGAGCQFSRSWLTNKSTGTGGSIRISIVFPKDQKIPIVRLAKPSSVTIGLQDHIGSPSLRICSAIPPSKLDSTLTGGSTQPYGHEVSPTRTAQ